MPCQERHAMPRAPPGRRFATHRVDKLRRRAEVSPSSASSLSVRCRAEVIIAHTPSTLFTYETPTLIVEKSIARLALGSADTCSCSSDDLSVHERFKATATTPKRAAR